MRRLIVAIIVSGLTFLRCSISNPVSGGGGDDFPNAKTASVYGERIAYGLNSYSTWNNLFNVPDSIPSMTGGYDLQIPSASSAGLSKRLATQNDTIIYDYSDTASGVLKRYHTSISSSVNVYDTVVERWDANARDSVIGNEHLIAVRGLVDNLTSGELDYYRFEDYDGDGLMNDTEGVQNAVKATLTTAYANGDTGWLVIAIDAGPDKVFDIFINDKILHSYYLKKNKTDTLMLFDFRDGDGDSVVYSGASDSCIIDMLSIQPGGWFSPVIRQASFVRFAAFPRDTSKRSYPLRFWSNNTYWSGMTQYATIFGHRPDSCFYAHDTATALIITTGSFFDTIQYDTFRLTAHLGDVPSSLSDDSLISVYSHTLKQWSTERNVTFSFLTHSPVAIGQLPLEGSVGLHVKNIDSSWTDIQGTFSADSITGVFIDSKPSSWQIIWNRNGDLLDSRCYSVQTTIEHEMIDIKCP
jgi:hypothetical protein